MSTLKVSSALEFQDVYGLDPELLQMVPQPVEAVIFLFPITEKFEKRRSLQLSKVQEKVSPNVFFTRQTIGNACGTVGIIHCLANSKNVIVDDGPFKEYLDLCKDCKTPEERAVVLETCSSMGAAHAAEYFWSLFRASRGQTEAPSAESDIDLHFIAFIKVDGSLYEMDGLLQLI